MFEKFNRVSDIGTVGYVVWWNRDTTNYVEIGSTTGVYDTKIKAGEFQLTRWNGSAFYLKANTAACVIKAWIFED